jgi:hypothetical protein
MSGVLLWCACAQAASDPIKLELSVAPELSKFSDILFSAPSYAALALQNSGMALSLSKPMTVLSRQSFQIGPGKVVYQEKKGKVYHYDATMELAFGKEVSVPFEIDATDMEAGHLHIRAYPVLSGLIPQELIVRVESKIQILTNANAQKQLVAYLTERLNGKTDDTAKTEHLFDAIAFDAYNQAGRLPGGAVGSSAGAPESVGSQAPLIVAVLIWLIGFPIFVYIVRRQRALKIKSDLVPQSNS